MPSLVEQAGRWCDLALCFGPDMPDLPGRAAFLHHGHHVISRLGDPGCVDDHGRRGGWRQRRPHHRCDGLRASQHRCGLVEPGGALLGHGSGFVFGVAGFQRCLLRQVLGFDRCRWPAVIMLELDRELCAAGLDVGAAGRPPLVQSRFDTHDLADRPLARVGAGPFGEPHPQRLAEVLFQCGVVGLRGGDVGFEQHPSVDGQPAPVEGLHLVRDRDVGVQIGVAGAAIAVGERGRHQASDVDLPDPLWPGPGEQGMLLDEFQRVLHGRLMGAFDDGRGGRIGDRPQGGDRLHRGERQVIASHRLSARTGVFRNLAGQFSCVHRLAAMLGEEELAGHFGPHLRPLGSEHGSAGRPAGRRIDSGEASCHFEAERADITVNDHERRPKSGPVLVVARIEVGSGQLLLTQLDQGVQATAEQCSHLLSGHRITRIEAVDPVQAGTGPHSGRLAPFGVVDRQPGATSLRRIQRSDLPGQVVIPRACSELVNAHRHTHPKGYMPSQRSRRPGVHPSVHGVCRIGISEMDRGYVELLVTLGAPPPTTWLGPRWK